MTYSREALAFFLTCPVEQTRDEGEHGISHSETMARKVIGSVCPARAAVQARDIAQTLLQCGKQAYETSLAFVLAAG
jgi:hypothetical protein